MQPDSLSPHRPTSFSSSATTSRKANPIIELKVPRDEVISSGIYTVHNRILKLTAQGGIDFAILEDRKFKTGPLGERNPTAEVLMITCKPGFFGLHPHRGPDSAILP